MRYFILLALTSILFCACSSTKNLELSQVNQEPCKNEIKITEQNPFYGETVENFVAYQQGDNVLFTMDARTYCKTNLSLIVDKQGDVVKLKINTNGQTSSDCVCNVKLSSNIKNLEPGNYTFMVTDISGTKLLGQQSLSVK